MASVPSALRRFATSKGANSQALFNTLGLVVLYGVNFFTLPLFSRLLGAAGFGTFSLFTSWAQIGTVIVGLQVQATIPMAAVSRDQRGLERYAAAVLTLVTAATVLLIPIAVVWDAPLAHLLGLDGIPVLMVLVQAYFAAVVGLSSQLFVNQLRAVMNFVLSATLTLAGVILSGVLMLGPLRSNTALGRISGAFSAYVIIGIGLVIFLYARGRVVVDRDAWAFCLPISIPLILHGLSAVVLAQIGKVMLQQITGDYDLVGYYGMAVTTASLLQALLFALNNTWVPFFYQMLAASGISPESARGSGGSKPGEGATVRSGGQETGLAQRAGRFVSLFTCLACGLTLIAPEVVRIFAGRGFEPAVAIMPLMIGAVFFNFLYLLPVNYELYLRNSRYVSVGTMLAALAAVALSYPLISLWGLWGAALANLLAYVFLFGFHSLLCRFRMPDYPFALRMFYAPVIAYGAAAVLMSVALRLPIVRWLMAAAVGLLLAVRVVQRRTLF